MSIIGWLIGLIERSIFLGGEIKARLAHPLSKIAYLAILIYTISRGDLIPVGIALASIIILGATAIGVESILSTLIVSSIPAFWLASTAYVGGIAGITPYITLVTAIGIFIRSMTFSSAILLFIASLNPTRIANLLIRLGKKTWTVYPLLSWRLIPQGLHDMGEALSIYKLKKATLWKSIASSIATIIDYTNRIEESAFYRIEAGLEEQIPLKTNIVWSTIYVALSIGLIMVQLFI